MASKLTRTTTDHDEIRRWAEERGAEPAEVASTERDGETGMIRLDFPGYSGARSLQHISWDEWFDKFDQSGLALVYQERTAGGERSNFNKLVGLETAEARQHGDNRASRRRLRAGGSRRSEGARAGTRRGRTRRTASARGGSRRTSAGSGRKAARRGSGERRGGSRAEGRRQRSATGRRTSSGAKRTGRTGRLTGKLAMSGGSREAPRSVVARLTGRVRVVGEGGRSSRRSGRSGSRRGGGRTSARSGGRSRSAGRRTRRGGRSR